MSSPDPVDLTPVTGAATDVAPLGRAGDKPPHERTGVEEIGLADWDAIAATREFKELLRSKARFIVPATIFFVLYYFALPVLVGYAPELMARKVWGNLNIAYVFALSQFFMAWALAIIYVGVAMGWDRRAEAILARFGRKSGQ
jgi:uncharacterized membrane protein (DUF485 family)